MDTIVDPLVVSDLATVVWSPHGHTAGGRLAPAAGPGDPDRLRAVSRTRRSRRSAPASSRSGPTSWTSPGCARHPGASGWRRPSIPPQLRRELRRDQRGHRPPSARVGDHRRALLRVARLAARLGAGIDHGSQTARSSGAATARRQDVELTLEPDPTMTVARAGGGHDHRRRSGTEIDLNRGPGGLSARRRTKDGKESTWTVLGASRGEAGILGEGIRQALLRDPTYAPALEAGAARCSRERVRGRRLAAGERVPADRPVRLPLRLRDLRPGGAERQRGVALPPALRLARASSAPSSTATPAGSASAPPTWRCRPTAATCRARWCSRPAGARAAAGSSSATCC